MNLSAQNHPIARKHLVSHALRWTLRLLKVNDLEFSTSSLLALVRGGSFDGLSIAGDLQLPAEEGDIGKEATESTEEWISMVIESNGAAVEQKSSKKAIELLRIAIEVGWK